MSAVPFFLATTNGARFCIHTPAQGAARGTIVYVPPFAEEMNKSRRMAALQARAFAAAGYDVLQIDLHGCGDSDGDHGDATWESWLADVDAACRWARDRHSPSLWLWGLRSGCLLAAEAAARLEQPCNLLFWQAPAAGKPLMQQFLRLKMAGELLGGDAKGITETLRKELAAGRPIEIAGYALSPALVSGFEAAELNPPAQGGRLEWLEISNREAPALTPVSEKRQGQWQGAGFSVRSQVVRGPAFWQTTEIEEAPLLLQASVAALT